MRTEQNRTEQNRTEQNRTEQLSETYTDLEKHLEEIQRCYDKWKSPNISYIAFLNHGEKQRGNEAWEAIEKIAKAIGWEAGSHE